MAIVPALTKPDGSPVHEKMWIGNLPDATTPCQGGTLAWLDPKSLASGSHRNLLPDCSPFALLWLPESKQLLVGMSIEGGTGTKPKAKNGAFVIWDPIADKAIYTGDFGLKDMADVVALAPAGNGLVYALLGHTRYTFELLGEAVAGPTRVALIDPAARKIVSIATIPADFGRMPEQIQFTLFRGPDAVYGMTEKTLFRLKPGTCEMEPIWRAPASDANSTARPLDRPHLLLRHRLAPAHPDTALMQSLTTKDTNYPKTKLTEICPRITRMDAKLISPEFTGCTALSNSRPFAWILSGQGS